MVRSCWNRNRRRLLQLKQLSRKFSATMLGAAGPDDQSEMRLLPTPLFRYSSKSGLNCRRSPVRPERHGNESRCARRHSMARRGCCRPLGIRLHGDNQWWSEDSPGGDRGLVAANSRRTGTCLRDVDLVLFRTYPMIHAHRTPNVVGEPSDPILG
jgi:hypothetical protein